VASRGRHTWSHPQLPLATPEADPEVIFRKGKSSEGETSTTEPGNLPSPFVGTPFSSSQLPSRLFSKGAKIDMSRGFKTLSKIT
jgi:hypothetical protein